MNAGHAILGQHTISEINILYYVFLTSLILYVLKYLYCFVEFLPKYWNNRNSFKQQELCLLLVSFQISTIV